MNNKKANNGVKVCKFLFLPIQRWSEAAKASVYDFHGPGIEFDPDGLYINSYGEN